MGVTSQASRVAAVASIQDAVRRSLYDLACHSPVALGRDEAAEQLGIPRATAAFHLDRLVEAGLLEVEFQRRSGKTGPGSGRPAKLYRPVAQEISVTIPERHYDVIGDVLAGAIEESDRTGEPVRTTLERAATARGREIGAGGGSLEQILEIAGYEPVADGSGGIALANCPFHRLAASHTEIICQANLCLLTGVAETADDNGHTVEFTPGAGHCCVTVTGA